MQISGVVAIGKRNRPHAGLSTANILPDEGSVLPEQNGVYAAVLTLEDGRALPCVLNKGRHPTLPEGAATVEAFIFDFAGDLSTASASASTFARSCVRKRAFPARTNCAHRSPATRRTPAPGSPRIRSSPFLMRRIPPIPDEARCPWKAPQNAARAPFATWRKSARPGQGRR